ncbi:hypothetical protein [Microbispora sp. H11081]|uniref:hypothetical protein n=1 Tax=Microbispora sp. H11081 TaxID=2729107 RepID=UPI001474ABC7|nr:hypothetical protein [Microbispora sp. H11081]
MTPTAGERALAVSGGTPVLRDAVTTDGTSVLVYTFRYAPLPDARRRTPGSARSRPCRAGR